jgi:hypothetical protein
MLCLRVRGLNVASNGRMTCLGPGRHVTASAAMNFFGPFSHSYVRTGVVMEDGR